MGIVIACTVVGGLVISACFVVTWRTQRARERLTATDESALDRALFHLINDVARDEPPREPTLARTRMPRGTPSDSVLLGTRLRTLPAIRPHNAFDEDAPTTVAVAYVFDRPRH